MSETIQTTQPHGLIVGDKIQFEPRKSLLKRIIQFFLRKKTPTFKVTEVEGSTMTIERY